MTPRGVLEQPEDLAEVRTGRLGELEAVTERLGQRALVRQDDAGRERLEPDLDDEGTAAHGLAVHGEALLEHVDRGHRGRPSSAPSSRHARHVAAPVS